MAARFFAFLTVCYLFSIPDSIRLPAGIAAAIAYAWLVYRRPFGQTVFHAVAVVLMLGVADATFMFFISLLPGADFSMVTGQTVYRLYVMLFSKLVFLFMVFLFSNYRSSTVKNPSYWLTVIFPPTISMAMLAALMQYGMAMNASGKWELIVISLGILVMNGVLMVLHGRLSRNTWQLVENEKTLQQAKLQNIYLNEVIAASDSLRGFRHDLKNHLQV